MITSRTICSTVVFCFWCFTLVISQSSLFLTLLLAGTYGMAAPWYFPILPSYWKERFGCAEVKHEKSNGLMFTNIMMQNTNPSASKTSGSTICIILREMIWKLHEEWFSLCFSKWQNYHPFSHGWICLHICVWTLTRFKLCLFLGSLAQLVSIWC